ncbi:MAG TPA: alpha/beta hydrolase [Chitinophagaceae bacterium]|nr:alpha/beta hydrolase [Chitinophagaceae bacterium]HQZ75836.1 alpha/beta hydrolase [Chitinophagaceae bacterium]
MNKEIQITGKKIFYRVTGEGNPVMLVHGFGEDGTVWNNQVDFLKDKFRIIIPDLPGSGKSELIENSSLEDMAEVLHQIIHEEDIDHCVMIGHSMGGYITLAFAEMYWNHLTAFGLFHSSAYADSKEKITTRQKGIEFINEHGAFAFLKTATPNLFSPLTKAENPGLIDKQINSLDNFSPAALVSYYEAMISRPDRTAILLQATVPVLFIIGKYDNAVPPEDSLQQCHLPEKSYIHMLNRSGHMGMLEEPQQSNQILEKFLLDI